MTVRRVVALWIYPLKGARGILRSASDVLLTGLRGDRRFMLVDDDGVFLSQRGHPRLSLVETELRDGGAALAIRTPGGCVEVSTQPTSEASRVRLRVRVWHDDVDAVVVPGDASAMLSDHLGARCTLVWMPPDAARAVDPQFSRPGDVVSFADAFPVLVASQASLDDLNARLAQPIGMDRFRPNVVVAGGEAWEEDRFAAVRIGAMTFRTPKRCARCEVTLVDPRTAERGKEPLRTLATFRRDANEVHFAQNAIPDAPGAIAVGDEVHYT